MISKTLSSHLRVAAFVAAATVFSVPSSGFAQGLKVDISNSGRQVSEGLDPAFTPWATDYAWFAGGDSTSATFGATSITFTRTGAVGTALKPSYWKNGVVDLGVKLTGDGIKVDDGDAGAQIEMRIAGLTAGSHTLLLYLNNWDGVTDNAPLDILVDGSLVVDNLAVTTRVTDSNDASTAYLQFTATAGTDVVVLIKAETSGSEAAKNVHINGFELDTSDTDNLATNPVPADGDIHADADSGSATLNWTAAASGADSHDVYIGTSESAVTDATNASSEFKGNQTSTNYLASGLDSMQSYYWRIDEVSGGTTTKGNIWSFRPRRLAFPGAEGYGRFAQGGRGGVVVKVTNLNDSGPGSLREAIFGDYGPRTVIFDVSGLITLTDDIILNGDLPFLTIAGQTAPGKGICIKREQFAISGADDVIFRYIRGLVGKETGATQNATGMAGADHSIMDHCSFGWGIDEGLSTRGGSNLTFQRCNLSEALNIAGHANYGAGTRHGYAASVGGDIASLHHNLLAHNEGRNWSLAGGLDGAGFYSGRLDIFNNVVYNWRSRTTDGGAHEVNFVGNYYKPGPSTSLHTALNPQYGGFPGTQQYYMAGNVMPGYFDETNQSAGLNIGTESGGTLPGASSPPYTALVGSPFFPSHATIHSAENAYKQVLSDVGCNLPMIDDRDTRIITETLNGTYTYIGSASGDEGLPDTTGDVGGWEDYGNVSRAVNWDSDDDGMPDWWEEIHGFNPNSAAGDFSESNADLDGDEFTNLEEYLNWMATPNAMCNAGATVDVDLQALSRGYTSSPSHVISNEVNGTVSLIGGDTARFSATPSTNSLGSFDFTVTDSAGDSMTRTVVVRIIGSGSGPIAPPAPAGLVATAGDGQVQITWNASSGATSYRVKRSTTSGSGYATLSSPTGLSYSDTSVTNGTLYYYVVTAANTGGESGNSNQDSATPSGGGSSEPVTIQVEDADEQGGGITVETEHGGNGSGYVNFPSSGGYTQFNNVDGGPGGAGMLTVRFALGNTSRTGLLLINGVSEPISFPDTSAWNSWQTMDVPINLNAGEVNTIRFETNGSDLANLDEITIQPAAAVGTEVEISATLDTAGEYGAATTLEFTLTRTGDTGAALDVPLVASGSATSGDDYSGFTGIKMIPAGETEAVLTLTVETDEFAEGSETVIILLGASGDFAAVALGSATGTINDNPSQDYFFHNIADETKRGMNDNADADSQVNIIEYFMGTDPDDSSSRGIVRVASVGSGTFGVRYPMASGRSDVTGSLYWSKNLENWYADGESDGTHTVSFSAPASPVAGEPADIVEVTATVTGPGEAEAMFVQLGVDAP